MLSIVGLLLRTSCTLVMVPLSKTIATLEGALNPEPIGVKVCFHRFLCSFECPSFFSLPYFRHRKSHIHSSYKSHRSFDLDTAPNWVSFLQPSSGLLLSTGLSPKPILPQTSMEPDIAPLKKDNCPKGTKLEVPC